VSFIQVNAVGLIWENTWIITPGAIPGVLQGLPPLASFTQADEGGGQTSNSEHSKGKFARIVELLRRTQTSAKVQI